MRNLSCNYFVGRVERSETRHVLIGTIGLIFNFDTRGVACVAYLQTVHRYAWI